MKATDTVFQVYEAIRTQGGRPVMIGGCVRDYLMGITPKDIDTEVYGLTVEQLVGILGRYGKVNTVGVSFGVIKLRVGSDEFDFSLPRRDSKVAAGHKGIRVSFDEVDDRTAASRRDYTINSVGADIWVVGDRLEIKLVDHFGGQEDLRNRVLRATSVAFAEDPLRVLRGMQFAGRYDMTVERETARLAYQIRDEYEMLAKERIWGEWYKWATKSIRPSAGLAFLYATKWIYLYPELSAMIGLEQEPEWHPEGSCYVHTGHVCDAAMYIARREGLDEERRAALVFGALCHDMGKSLVTVVNEKGRIASPGHAEAGVPLAESFMRSIGAPERFVREAMALTQYHMRHVGGVSGRGARRLARELDLSRDTTPYMIGLVMEADASGRPWTGETMMPEEGREFVGLMTVAEQAVRPLIQGRDLLAYMAPGPNMGRVIKMVEVGQVEGTITNAEEAMAEALLMIREMEWGFSRPTKERPARPARTPEQVRPARTPGWVQELYEISEDDDLTNCDDI